jgi:site-specific DNA-methyltransferase (adenine-specific)
MGRRFVCVDQNQPAIDVMAKRLGAHAEIISRPPN